MLISDLAKKPHHHPEFDMPQRQDTPASAPQRRRLGRGLDSLVSTPVRIEIPRAGEGEHAAETRGGRPMSPPGHASLRGVDQDGRPDPSHPAPAGISLVAVADISPNRNQPRQQFDETALSALAESIRADGLMQPIVVRRSSNVATKFELIAGERRWRAAQRIGLQRVPAVIRDVDDRVATELALIENLQREDLNPIERAEAFEHLAEQYAMTHEQIGARLGLDRASVSNLIRLNKLDMFTKDAVRAGGLSLGHARALLAIVDEGERTRLARRALQLGWSVRELERQTQQAAAGTRERSADNHVAAANRRDLERRLGEHLGTKVRIVTARKKGAGRVVIDFFSFDQFEGLMERMGYRSDDSP
jgi:ParB family chromosome partitioning protein